MSPQPTKVHVLAIARLSLLSLFWFSSAIAQYHFDSWTTDNGLPQNSIFSIIQTRDGYLWMSTFDGLVRFDGVQFKVFDKVTPKDSVPTASLLFTKTRRGRCGPERATAD